MNRRRNSQTLGLFFAVALLVHAAGLVTLAAVWPYVKPVSHVTKPQVMELVDLDSKNWPKRPELKETEPVVEPEPVVEEPEIKKPLDEDGQIVEIAPPLRPERPEKADYLAEYDQTVPEETRSERFKVNPDILAPRYSEEQKIEMAGENVEDLDMTRPSTGATIGQDRFDPDKHGMLSSVPSKWKVTNRQGLQDPVPASALQSVLAGAPQNDLLSEKRGAEVALNTKEFMYAGYLLRIRRLVNFYWTQNLDNLPSSVRLARPEYTTKVKAVLDGKGSLSSIKIEYESGSAELDDAVVRAFRVAGPYPNPPAGLIDPDGFVYLPDMGFTVKLGAAEMRYDGVDPRAGVQFPGLLKSPR